MSLPRQYIFGDLNYSQAKQISLFGQPFFFIAEATAFMEDGINRDSKTSSGEIGIHSVTTEPDFLFDFSNPLKRVCKVSVLRIIQIRHKTISVKLRQNPLKQRTPKTHIFTRILVF